MAKNKGGNGARQPNVPRRRRNNNGGARATNSTGIRTVNISVVSPNLFTIGGATVTEWPVQGSVFPGLKAHLDHAIEWRVRSSRISFTSLKSTEGYSVAAYLAPVGAAWKPADWVSMETSGGVIKPVKNSGWSSNTTGVQEMWFNHANPSHMFYMCGVGGPTAQEKVGVITLHATVQLRGNR